MSENLQKCTHRYGRLFWCAIACVHLELGRGSHRDSLLPCDTRSWHTLSWRCEGEQGRLGNQSHQRDGRSLQCKPSCSSLLNQPDRRRSLSLCFLHCVKCYSSLTGLWLTQFSLKSVVSFGASGCGDTPIAMKPPHIAEGVVPTARALEGAHSWHAARTGQKRHIVNSQAPIKTRANRFKHQLEGWRSGESDSLDRKIVCFTTLQGKILETFQADYSNSIPETL